MQVGNCFKGLFAHLKKATIANLTKITLHVAQVLLLFSSATLLENYVSNAIRYYHFSENMCLNDLASVTFNFDNNQI